MNAVEACALLLDRGGDLGARKNKRYTPLHWAAALNRLEACALLLDRGADPRAVDKRGKTPAEQPRAKKATRALFLSWRSTRRSRRRSSSSDCINLC